MLSMINLFAGMGGAVLGMQRAGFTPVGMSEIAEFPSKVLAKHWPDVPNEGDVRKAKFAAWRGKLHLLTGGFPCQDISSANPNAVGLTGLRSVLWYEQLRLIDELEPRYVVAENSPVLRAKGLDALLRSLDAIGYDAEWHCIPAAFAGAWHKRDRIWILAYPNSKRGSQRCSERPILRQSHLSGPAPRGTAQWPGRSNLPTPYLLGSLNGVPNAAHRITGLGNSVYVPLVELIGRAIVEDIDECLYA